MKAGEVNSCIELAGVVAARGRSVEAVGVMQGQCAMQRGATGLFPAALAAQLVTPHACRLLDALKSGRQPRRLSEIFQLPIDGSQYVDPSDPRFGK